VLAIKKYVETEHILLKTPLNIVDIGLIVDHYGEQPVKFTRADINNDGKINIVDIGIVVDNYS